jgi:acyl-CoA synthetase (AMP-forming)/AMP-acid ligase II
MAATLLESLAQRARKAGDQEAFAFHGRSLTYAELWRSVRVYAAWLAILGIRRNEPVLIALPNGPEFFSAFFGVQLAGGIPVPLFPGSGVDRLEKLARKVEASRAIVSDRRAAANQLNSSWLNFLPGLEPDAEPGPAVLFPSPDDLAFIQFTSGSTGEPKGVQITQAGLMTNIRQMVLRMGFTDEDIFVSWLPVYHDMGLILMTMVPFYLGCRLELLPARLTALREWIRTLSERRATFTAAPDFAYRMVLAYVSDPGTYDLRSLRAALSGAEQIRSETVQAFETAFGLENVITAGYGLAEATVGVSMTEPGHGLRWDARGLASVGRPLEGIDIAILAEDGGLAGNGVVGEVLVRSPANTPGYFGDAAATEKLLWEDGFIRTGDLGYLDAGGELYILAREKNMIKQAGRTIAPQEIETLVEAHPQVRSCAAVGIDLGGMEGEQSYVFTELRVRRKLGQEVYHEIGVSLVEAIHGHLGFRPGRLLLLQPGAIPRTPNGKLQHQRLRGLYLQGEMDSEIVYPKMLGRD